jgi:hypothetical protein
MKKSRDVMTTKSLQGLEPRYQVDPAVAVPAVVDHVSARKRNHQYRNRKRTERIYRAADSAIDLLPPAKAGGALPGCRFSN